MKKENKHHGSSKRPHRIEISYSESEWEMLTQKAEEAGIYKLASMIRGLSLNGEVHAALIPEEREIIANLHKVGVNLWALRGDIMSYNVGESFARQLDSLMAEDLVSIVTDLKHIIAYFKTKL